MTYEFVLFLMTYKDNDELGLMEQVFGHSNAFMILLKDGFEKNIMINPNKDIFLYKLTVLGRLLSCINGHWRTDKSIEQSYNNNDFQILIDFWQNNPIIQQNPLFKQQTILSQTMDHILPFLNKQQLFPKHLIKPLITHIKTIWKPSFIKVCILLIYLYHVLCVHVFVCVCMCVFFTLRLLLRGSQFFYICITFATFF